MKLLGIDFGSIFTKKKSTSVIGIDIGSSAIKVVQLKKHKGVVILETYGALSLGQYAGLEIGQATSLPAPELSVALKDLLKEANVTSNNAGMSIPFSSSLISTILMPKISKEKLAQMIPLEARKYIPVPIGEVTLDWFVIPDERRKSFDENNNLPASRRKRGKTNQTEVLLVAIHNNTLNKYNEIVQTVNLNASFFEVEIFSAIRSVVEQRIVPVMVLDIGASHTKLYIVEYGLVKKSHVINSGGQNITQSLARSLGISISKAEELKQSFGVDDSIENIADERARTIFKDVMNLGLNRIFSEANKVLLQYQRRNNKNIDSVILIGGGATIKGLRPVAEKYLATDVLMGDPFSRVETPAFFENILKEVGPDFAVAFGLAFRKLQEM